VWNPKTQTIKFKAFFIKYLKNAFGIRVPEAVCHP